MADDDIPQHLIDLQQKVDAAQAATKQAAREDDQAVLDQRWQEEHDAVNALVDARTGTPWEPWAGQRILHAAARPDAE